MGSRLAISDVAVAAAAVKAALEGVVMNVFINTKSLKARDTAAKLNAEAEHMVEDGCRRLDAVYCTIKDDMIAD